MLTELCTNCATTCYKPVKEDLKGLTQNHEYNVVLTVNIQLLKCPWCQQYFESDDLMKANCAAYDQALIEALINV